MPDTNRMGIVFDLDGTLVNSLADICTIVNLTRQSYQLKPMSNSEIAQYVGLGLDNLLMGVFGEALDKAKLPEVIKQYRHLFATFPRSPMEVYPGVASTLRTLQQQPHIRLGVCTNKQTEMAVKTLKDTLPDFTFDAIVGPDMVEDRKPHPGHLLETLIVMGCDPKISWYIGDDDVDAETAKNAKVKFLAAAYGFGGVAADPSITIVSFPEILTHIGQTR